MTFLITGGSGFLGRALIKRLSSRGVEIIVLARNEAQLLTLSQEFKCVRVYAGDIRDSHFVNVAAAQADGIFHLAAFKHVGLAERNVRQTILSNVIGTLNVLDASCKFSAVQFVLGISSDKAEQVTGVYGATKMLQERLFEEFGRVNPDVRYLTIRYGNVAYSTGSVLCKWRQQLEKGEALTITDPEATRFLWTVDQALDAIFHCLTMTKSTTYVPQMKAVCMGALFKAFRAKYSVPHLRIKVIGLQPGENLHESIGGVNSAVAEHYTFEELLEVV